MTKFVGSLADAFRLVFEHMEAHPDERVTVALGGETLGTLPSMNELKEGACQHLTVIDTMPAICAQCGEEVKQAECDELLAGLDALAERVGTGELSMDEARVIQDEQLKAVGERIQARKA